MTTPGVDHAAAVAALRERFPSVHIWYGIYTGRYRAIIRGELVEAYTAQQLGRLLESGFTLPKAP